MKNDNRITILDGFRCIAILMVLLYHFYSRWAIPISTVNYYPYRNGLADHFRYGYFGVNFFFIISGFVIFYTLEKSKSIVDFLLKRFIRLFPPILLCSVITWFFIKGFDSNNHFPQFHSNTWLNFLPSLTFSNPTFWAGLLHRPDIRYINSAYWSLRVEVAFYLISSILFFRNKQKFVTYWMWLLVPSSILRVVCIPEFGSLFSNIPQLAKSFRILNWIGLNFKIFNYLIYFSLGILFYCFYFKKQVATVPKYLCIFFTVAEFCFLPNTGLRVIFLLITIAFLLFIYKPRYIALFTNALLTRIGVISYTVYLIHENIGVVIINWLGGFIHSGVLIRFIPLLVITIFIGFAEISYRLYEKPVSGFLKRLLIKQKPSISNK